MEADDGLSGAGVVSDEQGLSCPTCAVVDAAVAFLFSRESYNALVAAVNARERWAKARTCRRCTTCEDFEHHWIEDPQPDVVTDWTCKHCPARGVECPACDGDEDEAEDCDVCNGAMVVRAEPMGQRWRMAECIRCNGRGWVYEYDEDGTAVGQSECDCPAGEAGRSAAANADVLAALVDPDETNPFRCALEAREDGLGDLDAEPWITAVLFFARRLAATRRELAAQRAVGDRDTLRAATRALVEKLDGVATLCESSEELYVSLAPELAAVRDALGGE